MNLKIIVSLIFLIIISFSVSCHGTPNWKIAAYNNGPLSEGTIMEIAITSNYSAWDGYQVCYILSLDNGFILQIHDWEMRRAKGLKIGDRIIIYYAWQAGHVIEIAEKPKGK